MADIDFFGFTGENTLKDISDWIKANPDDVDLFIATIIEKNIKIKMDLSEIYNTNFGCFDDYNTFPLTLLVVYLSNNNSLLYNKYVQSWNKKASESDADVKLMNKQLNSLANKISDKTEKISDPLEFLKGKADLKKNLNEIIRDFEKINMNNGHTLADYATISLNWFSEKEQGETDLYKKTLEFAKKKRNNRNNSNNEVTETNQAPDDTKETVIQNNEEVIKILDTFDKRLHKIKSEIEKTEKPRRQFVFTGAARAYITANGGDTEKRDTEKQYKFVQFHPSFDYTDFVEGLKPAVIGYDGDKPITHFVRMDGVFKKFCRKAAAELEYYFISKAKEQNLDPENLNEEEAKKIKFEAPKYFFIIDEINRADLSRVFGELMYCLEESYRGKRYRIDTQYQNLLTYEYKDNSDTATKIDNDIFAKGFYIPENVVIIGTMNDIDRSVETFDFALRRRFRWINITAEESMEILEERLDGIYKHDDKNNELKKRIEALNKKIGNDPKLGEAFQLGQSYFTKITSTKEVDLKDYFVNELKPILEEYVRGWKKTDAETFVNDCKTAFAPQPPTSNKGSN